jgi:hypothetical protein
VSIPGKAANGSGGGGSGGGVEAALSNFSNAVTGWGRNLLGAGVVESLATNEGIKALVTGRSGGGGGTRVWLLQMDWLQPLPGLMLVSLGCANTLVLLIV